VARVVLGGLGAAEQGNQQQHEQGREQSSGPFSSRHRTHPTGDVFQRLRRELICTTIRPVISSRDVSVIVPDDYVTRGQSSHGRRFVFIKTSRNAQLYKHVITKQKRVFLWTLKKKDMQRGKQTIFSGCNSLMSSRKKTSFLIIQICQKNLQIFYC
jgi:hypothetical protein